MKKEIIGQNITPIYTYTCEGCGTSDGDYDRTEGVCIKCGKEICNKCSEDITLLGELNNEIDYYYSEIPIETIDLEICQSCAKELKLTQSKYNKQLSKLIKNFNKELKQVNNKFIGGK